MEVIFILLGISILLASGFLAAFFWADKSGQNDDLYSPGVRILWEEKPADEVLSDTKFGKEEDKLKGY